MLGVLVSQTALTQAGALSQGLGREGAILSAISRDLCCLAGWPRIITSPSVSLIFPQRPVLLTARSCSLRARDPVRNRLALFSARDLGAAPKEGGAAPAARPGASGWEALCWGCLGTEQRQLPG